LWDTGAVPMLKNSRWELFAKLTARGATRGDAFFGAGFTANHHGQPSMKIAGTRGSNLFTQHPEIQARIEELVTEEREGALVRSQIDREYVLKQLKENHDRAMQAEPVRNRQGMETGEFNYQGSVANRSLELMGKELGMFADRIQFENLDSELGDMDADQLRNFIRGAATEVGLRMVDQNDAELREYIFENAHRVGLRVVEESCEGAGGTEDAEAVSVPTLSNPAGVPRSGTH